MGIVQQSSSSNQFEELFTLYPEHWEERECFFKQVRDALRNDPLLRVCLLDARRFYAELDPYVSLLPEKLRTRFRMEPLRGGRRPWEQLPNRSSVFQSNGHRKFADVCGGNPGPQSTGHQGSNAGGELRKSVAKFVEALQLQVVCRALWDNLSPTDELITAEHLEAYGDVDKALMHFYENAIEKTATTTGNQTGKTSHLDRAHTDHAQRNARHGVSR
jgi:hypothetical protein